MPLGFHFESVADIPDFPWVTRAFAGLSRLSRNHAVVTQVVAPWIFA
jgi:hypothetical protein